MSTQQRTKTILARAPQETEVDLLAQIWYDGWHEAHAALMPAELTRLRTLESFRDRLRTDLPDVRVAGPPGAAAGFCMIKGNELYQLFVAPDARGSGLAATLLADAEARLAAQGFTSAWLSCAIGNDRAARFYQKCGWRLTGEMTYQPDASDAGPIQVWRFEKELDVER
jgi:ribosomal protein S18 acetylase RimI-like enzyme